MASKKSPPKRKAHKRGANPNEMATKLRKVSKGFKQVRDIREDRGTRQTKLGFRKQKIYPGGLLSK